METWKFFDITHKEHTICNPTSVEKFGELIGLLRLEPGARLLELACGKGEFIVRMVERYGVTATGVDISPYCIQDAKEKLARRVPEARVELLEMSGADYRPPAGQLFDLAACIGASWIFNGHQGTLKALNEMVQPGGLIVVGEPYWRQEPDPDYLAAAGFEQDTFGSHYDNVKSGEAIGLTLLYTLVSNHDDWDRYEALQWYAADRYGRRHPDDPDLPELRARMEQQKKEYLQWGRDTLGWAIYLLRRP
jgi:SAM-dependent methyltransferase